jgi:crossover junction endodeoxyribonuclease RusA
MIRLTLPYPISANRYWRTYMPKGHRNPVTVVSGEARKYKAAVQKIALDSGVDEPMNGRVEIVYTLYPRQPKDYRKRMKKDPEHWDDTVQCIDLDNAQKVMFDAMKGVVFVDDDRVFRIVGRRVEPDENGARVEVQVSAM